MFGLRAHHGALLAADGDAEFNVLPDFAIYSIDHLLSDGRQVVNRYAAAAPNANIMSLSTGYIRSAAGGATVTNFFANGPAGNLTATRLQFATDATIFGVFSGAPPAGTYRITMKVKLNAGTSKNIRYGNPTIGYSTATVTDSAWTTITMDFTASGSNYTAWNLLPATSNSPIDLLIDEIQWYADEDFPIPAFATETWNFHHKKRGKGYVGAISRSGNLLDNTDGGGAWGVLCAPSFPAATTYTEWTAMVAFKYVTLGAGQMLVSETDAALGTNANSLQLGTNAGTGVQGQMNAQPLNFGNSRLEPLGEGWHVYAIRVKAGARSTHFNGIEMNSSSAAYSGFQARLLNFGGQSASGASKGYTGTTAFWDSYLSDDDLAQAFRKVRDVDIPAMGETAGAMPFFYIAEGDSITATATAPQGPSYAYIQAAAGWFSGHPPMYLRNRAVSGSGMTDVEARLAVTLTVIAQAVAAGAQPIVSLAISSNDTTWIGANGYLAYWARAEAVYSACRAAGAKVIACTLLPADTGAAGWTTERALYNTYARTRTDAYDALADFAADPDMGPDGAPTAGIYYIGGVDKLHPNTAGHAIIGGIMKTAMQTVTGY